MDNRISLKLFSSFFKIGAFTFGGGWAMISLIEREIVTKRQWIERTEFLDLLATSSAACAEASQLQPEPYFRRF